MRTPFDPGPPPRRPCEPAEPPGPEQFPGAATVAFCAGIDSDAPAHPTPPEHSHREGFHAAATVVALLGRVVGLGQRLSRVRSGLAGGRATTREDFMLPPPGCCVLHYLAECGRFLNAAEGEVEILERHLLGLEARL